MRALLGTALTAALIASTALTSTGSAAAAGDQQRERARRGPTLTITGNGYGHGHGLSQYGAQGAAGKGLGHRAILSFYYPALTFGSIGGDVQVLITADTTSDVMVEARPGLTVKSLDTKKTYRLSKKSARWWRIKPAQGSRRSVVAVKANGGWKTVRTVRGEAQFKAGGRPLTLRTPSGDTAYRGVLRSAAPSATSGKRDTVNVLPLESYLKGVVPREVPAQWHPAAVRAQAVAARTYAAFERRSPAARHYQICDTAECQVYGGYSAEEPESNQAVEATRKLGLLFRGEPAFTQFSASNGGYQSAGSVSYLGARKDPYDKAYRGWTDQVTAAEIEAALPAIGTFRSASVASRDGKGAFGGRVGTVRVVGSSASTTISGDAFRSWFGLRSTLFAID